MLRILLPAAGEGSRFRDKGYGTPKPLLPVGGVCMLTAVAANLLQHNAMYHVSLRLDQFHFGGVYDDRLTRFSRELVDKLGLAVHYRFLTRPNKGTACTVRAFEPDFDSNDEVIIANCDQLVEQGAVARGLSYFRKHNADGGLWCFFDRSGREGYVKLTDDRSVKEVFEKLPVTDHATCGIYYFRKARRLFSLIDRMVEAGDTVNGEFFLSPVFNWLVRDGGKVLPYFVNEHHNLGTPEAYEAYLDLTSLGTAASVPPPAG